ncbi:MAG: CvpA family protein [Legionella sp.]|uniref:CvpA family protein n=1 Tax=Legionella sp. TaxID=459 RepID=UPI0039E61F11
MQFQIVDLVIIAIIGLSSITGLFRGAVKEVIALGVWIVAIWTGYNQAQNLAPWLQNYIQNQTACTAIAFLIIVVGVLIAGAILNFILGLLLKRTGLSSMDKMLGMCFGFVRGVFMVSLILAILSQTSLPYQSYLAGSTIVPQLQPVVTWISGYIPTVLNQLQSVDGNVGGTIGNIINTIPRP